LRQNEAKASPEKNIDPGERVKGADILSHFDQRYESYLIR
jgi:hypothetical protein